MLLVGSEGEGLRPLLKKLVKFCVSLDKGSGTDSLVDSLNVSFFFFSFLNYGQLLRQDRSVLRPHYSARSSWRFDG